MKGAIRTVDEVCADPSDGVDTFRISFIAIVFEYVDDDGNAQFVFNCNGDSGLWRHMGNLNYAAEWCKTSLLDVDFADDDEAT